MEPIEEITPPTDLLRTSSLQGKEKSCLKYKAIRDYGKVEKELGSGGFGNVVIREGMVEEKQVLSKNVKASDPNNGLDSNLIRETSILMTLDSPLVVRLYDVQIRGETAELYMPHGGGSLRSYLKDPYNRPVSENDFKFFIKSCLIFLSQLSSRAIIHGDIKPENILQSEDLWPLFIDFGGAQQSVFLSDGKIQKIEYAPGTAFYKSPERLLYQPFDNTEDIWALGCVWVEALSKDSSDAHRAIEEAKEENYDRVRNLFSEEDEGYFLIRRMLAYKPEDRLSPRAYLERPYFSGTVALIETIDSITPFDVLRSRELKPFEFNKEMLDRREEVLRDLLIKADMGKFSNRTYFLAAKLFDVLLKEKYPYPFNIVNSTSCLLIAAKFYNEADKNILNTFSNKETGIRKRELYIAERNVYKGLCFMVNYSTPYDYLILKDKKDLVTYLRYMLRRPPKNKFFDEELVDSVIESENDKRFRSDFSKNSKEEDSIILRD